jgi:hypothetical protein
MTDSPDNARGPERIWLDTIFQPWRVWTIEMSDLPEYRRADLAAFDTTTGGKADG